MNDIPSKPFDDDPHVSQFSLFEGDLVNRLFARVGVGSRRPVDIFMRWIIIMGITWLPMAVISSFVYVPSGAPPSKNFFYDFAAYAQYFIGLPLFLIAEAVISENVLGAARDFYDSGVVAEDDKPKLRRIEERIAKLRKEMLPEIICIICCYLMAFGALGPELFWPAKMETWHVIRTADDHRYFTAAAAWAILVAIPIQTYFWVRWVWKIGLWYLYLAEVSKFKLTLVASHPDHTGGIGFLSEVQAKFALVILAYGISNVVATVGYKIAIEHAPINLPPVWGLVSGFVIGAPLLFLAPLLLFTKQLNRTKKRALAQFREKAMMSALRVEQQWLHSDAEHESAARTELAQLQLLSGFYDRIHHMRVVPFDLRSAAQLIGSAIGPIIPLIPYFVEMSEPWKMFLEVLTKWIPHGGG
ncbi:MAG: hypothetical protein U1E36_06985 [Rickettsiales bacterium]